MCKSKTETYRLLSSSYIPVANSLILQMDEIIISFKFSGGGQITTHICRIGMQTQTSILDMKETYKVDPEIVSEEKDFGEDRPQDLSD